MRICNTFRKPVQITNTETGEVLDFASLTDAGNYLGISRISVSKYLLNNLTYNKYTISAKGPLSLPDKEILDESNGSNSFTGKISHQPVLLTNKETGEKKEFSCMVDAAKYLGISNGRL
jgi:hypothetical protein